MKAVEYNGRNVVKNNNIDLNDSPNNMTHTKGKSTFKQNCLNANTLNMLKEPPYGTRLG